MWLCYTLVLTYACVPSLSTLMSSFLTVLLSLCFLFLSGAASFTLSLGLASWCDTVTDGNARPYRWDWWLMGLYYWLDFSFSLYELISR